MSATLPEFVAQEQRRGRLFRGAERRDESGARYGLFVAPKGGMNSLVDTLADRLPPSAVRLNSPVVDVRRQDEWQLTLGDLTVKSFDFVIVAVPSPAAGKVHASEKFPGRAPSDAAIIRVFLGGTANRELVELPSDDLSKLAHRELSSLLEIIGQPLWCDVGRWPQSMPQYHIGHLALVARIEARVERWPGLELAGNAYHGVGIPQCVRSGEAAAERVAASCA
jgi:oxygen-dependent protoporphyrinogen oxidase